MNRRPSTNGVGRGSCRAETSRAIRPRPQPRSAAARFIIAVALFAAAVRLGSPSCRGADSLAAEPVVVLEVGGKAETLRAGMNFWTEVRTNDVLHPGDQVRTKAQSRALLRLSDRSLMRM